MTKSKSPTAVKAGLDSSIIKGETTTNVVSDNLQVTSDHDSAPIPPTTLITDAVQSLDEETLYIALLKKEALLIDASKSIRDAAPMISRMLETFDRYLDLPTADETNPAVLKAQDLINKAKGGR